MAKIKGRKRKLKSVKDAAELRSKAASKPSRFKTVFKLIFKPFVVVGKWLNRPAYIHRIYSDDPSGSMLTKHRHLIPAYVRNSVAEMKIITWLKFPNAWRLTMAVFIFAAFFALLVAALDWVLTDIFDKLILRRG